MVDVAGMPFLSTVFTNHPDTYTVTHQLLPVLHVLSHSIITVSLFLGAVAPEEWMRKFTNTEEDLRAKG